MLTNLMHAYSAAHVHGSDWYALAAFALFLVAVALFPKARGARS